MSIPSKPVEIVEFKNFTGVDVRLLLSERSEPVLLRGFDIGPCLTKWTTEYLKSTGAAKQVKVHRSETPQLDFRKKNFTYETLSFAELVENCQGNTVSADLWYLRSLGDDPRGRDVSDLSKHFPDLNADLNIPELFPKEAFFSSVFRITSPSLQLWTHYDTCHNVLLQIRGRKRVVLFPPQSALNLYLDGDKSRVLDIDSPNVEEFPLFSQAERYEVILQEGDIVFIPALWFHNITALDFSVSVNVFWKNLNYDYYDKKDPYGNKDLIPAQLNPASCQQLEPANSTVTLPIVEETTVIPTPVPQRIFAPTPVFIPVGTDNNTCTGVISNLFRRQLRHILMCMKFLNLKAGHYCVLKCSMIMEGVLTAEGKVDDTLLVEFASKFPDFLQDRAAAYIEKCRLIAGFPHTGQSCWAAKHSALHLRRLLLKTNDQPAPRPPRQNYRRQQHQYRIGRFAITSMLSLINQIARREPQSRQFYEESFYSYMTTHCRDVLTEVLRLNLADVVHPVKIKYIELFNECQEIAEDLLMFPCIVLPECDKAAKRALTELYHDLRNDSVLQLVSPSKCSLRIRVFSLPDNESVNYRQIPSVKDAGTFICLRGTVVRSVTRKFLEYSKIYKCSKCKQQFWVDADVATFYTFPKVEICENKCVGAKVQPLDSKGHEAKGNYSLSKFRDYQEVKLQEADRKTALGTAKTVWVILEDDLVDTCKPGDDVYICGTAMLRWKPTKSDQISEVELAFLANHIEVNNDQRDSIVVTEEASQRFEEFWLEHQNDPFVGRNKILKSFCPNICGMYIVKLALSVILCGGVSKEKNGSKIRGESHLLLVGDPGTGKSQFLQYANMLCPRSILTTGIGTTNAGLTVSASKVGGEWQLEAGALVLADGGVCCIDEFSCIKEHDRTSIHEAMEQQSVSVAKAGMVCKLNTRCTIIGSTNPKGKYDPKESVPFNVGLATPLLSRFDVLLVLRDAQNEAWDSFLADFVLRDMTPAVSPPSEDSQCSWSTEQLQSYFAIAKELRPQMTDEATRVLSSYYQHQRNLAGRNKARTTVRLLESLVRLSEGHAKFMHRSRVILHDAITAITLVESSMLGSTLIGETNTLHASFPVKPKEEYYKQAKLILNALNLFHLWIPEQRRRPLEDVENVKVTSTQSTRPPLNKPEPSVSSYFAQSSHMAKREHQSQSTDLPNNKRIRLGSRESCLSEHFEIIDQDEEPGSPDMFPDSQDPSSSGRNANTISASTAVSGLQSSPPVLPTSQRPLSTSTALDKVNAHSAEPTDSHSNENSLEDKIENFLDSDAEEMPNGGDDSDIEDFM